MTKPTIVTRAGKGAPLSTTEGDSNFTNLRDATFSVLADGVTVSNELNSSFEIEAGSGITVSGNNTSKKIVIANSQSAGIATVSADTTPALGGNLNVAGNSIVSLSNGNIAITPNGTGSVVLDGQNWPQADGTANQYLKTNGSGQLSYATLPAAGIASVSADGSPTLGGDLAVDGFKIVTTSNNLNIQLDPHGTGVVAVTGPMTISGNLTVNGTTTTVNSTTVDIADKNITLAKGAVNAAAANGAGFTIEGPATPAVMEYVSATDRFLFNKQIAGSFFSNAASDFSGGTVNLGSVGNVTITGGTADYVLRTDGAGVLTWVAQSAGGIANVVEDTTPQLGGNLDVNGQSIVSVSNGNISITPNGTGSIVLDGQSWPQADGTANQYLKTNGSGQLSYATLTSSFVGTATSDLDMATFKIKSTSNQDLEFETASGTYGMKFKSNTNTFGYLDSNVTVTTNGTGSMTVKSATGGTIVVADNISSGGHITLTPAGSGKINLAGPLKTSTTSGTPTTFNTSYFEGTLDTPASWLKIDVGGSNYYLPMFQ
jgi:hypothetical protein